MNQHVSLAHNYACDVLDLKIPASHMVQLACQRYIDDLERAKTDWPYYFNAEKAAKTCKFIELLNHTKGEWGSRREKIRLEPWQCFMVCNIFGWVDRETGFRRFTEADIIVPRKNAKSTLASTIGLYMLVADGEYGSEVYSGATTEKQAMEVFKPALEMCRLNPHLVNFYNLKTNKTNIHSVNLASKFEPVIGKPGDGASVHCAIIDEYHEHPSSELYDTMRTGTVARRQPLILVITTAGDNLAGPCYDMILQGRKMLEGTIEDDTRFFIEYGIDPEDDWAVIETLRKANPNFEVSIFESVLRPLQLEAIRNPRRTGIFKTKHLNVWVQSRNAYFNIQRWNESYDPDLTEESLDLTQYRCIMGLDLASKQDIAALELLFEHGDGTFTTLQRYYLPEDVVELQGNEHYAAWHKAGNLTLTPGNMIDHEWIKDDVLHLCDKFSIEQIVFDPHQATWMMGTLMNLGMPVIEFPQSSATMSEPMKQLAGLIDGKKVRHNQKPNDPMTWMLSNVVNRNKQDRKDQVFPGKERNELKIDGPVALIMCMSQCLFGDDTSVYEKQGFDVW